MVYEFYLYFDGRKRYNCSIIDLYDRAMVATLNSSHMDVELAVQTLKIGVERNHHLQGLLLHSVQGSWYTSRTFTDFCKEAGVLQSMSKAGCPYDNSPMEHSKQNLFVNIVFHQMRN